MTDDSESNEIQRKTHRSSYTERVIGSGSAADTWLLRSWRDVGLDQAAGVRQLPKLKRQFIPKR
ncbi:MAG: hypothetical protein HOH70_04795 [Halieaceae bacterium]|jgi:hypothetical protein|nr:hypothetical protein [Halieaceae bacterium]